MEAGRSLVDLVAAPAVQRAWEQPSALAHLSIGVLAAHLVRALTTPLAYLDADEPPSDTPVVDAAGYMDAVLTDDDLDGALHRGIRERAQAAAEQGPQAVATQARDALAALRTRLLRTPAGRRVAVKDGIAITLDDYLQTRLVELVVHADDLAVSVGVPIELPGPARRHRARGAARARPTTPRRRRRAARPCPPGAGTRRRRRRPLIGG